MREDRARVSTGSESRAGRRAGHLLLPVELTSATAYYLLLWVTYYCLCATAWHEVENNRLRRDEENRVVL